MTGAIGDRVGHRRVLLLCSLGTGSTMMGGLIQRIGFAKAFGVAAGISVLALPYFLVANRRFARNP